MIFGFKPVLMNTAMGGDTGGGQGGDGGQGGGNPNPNPAPTNDFPEWAKGIDADLMNDPIMKNHKDVGSVVKSYVHAARMVGADKIVVPGKNATPEEVRAYISKLGLPESADKYELKLNDDSIFGGEKSAALKALAHQHNLLPSQLQGVMDYVHNELNSLVESDGKTSQQEVQAGLNGLIEKWGEEGFKKNAHLSHMTAKHFGGDEFLKYLNESGLGNDPKLIEVFSQIGSKLKQEDVFNREITSQYGMTKEEAQKNINALFADKAYLDASHPSHKDKVQDMLKYQQVLIQK